MKLVLDGCPSKRIGLFLKRKTYKTHHLIGFNEIIEIPELSPPCSVDMAIAYILY
jgi:hypothetical protein